MHRTNDNRDCGSFADNGDETLVMALRTGAGGADAESEPVLIARQGPYVILTLDDGERLTLDAGEVESAVRVRLRAAA